MKFLETKEVREIINTWNKELVKIKLPMYCVFKEDIFYCGVYPFFNESGAKWVFVENLIMNPTKPLFLKAKAIKECETFLIDELGFYMIEGVTNSKDYLNLIKRKAKKTVKIKRINQYQIFKEGYNG